MNNTFGGCFTDYNNNEASQIKSFNGAYDFLNINFQLNKSLNDKRDYCYKKFKQMIDNNTTPEEANEIADELYVNYFDFIYDLKTILKYVSQGYHAYEIGNEDPSIRKAVAIYGVEQDRLELINDKSVSVRLAIVKYGNEITRELLKNDKSKRVLAEIYKHTNNDELRNYVFTKNKLYPSMIKAVLSSNTTNKNHISKCKLLKNK